MTNALFRWFALVLALLPTLPSGAQPALPQKRVTLRAKNVPAAEVLTRLEKQFGVPFAYFQKPELLDQRVTVRAADEPLGPVLDRLFAQTALTYRFVGNQVVIRESPAAPTAYLTLRGTVLDGETGAPLPYAAVSLRGKAMGTVTNPVGEFVFHVPDRHAADTLLVSFLGYEPYRETVAEMAAQPRVTVRLSPAPVRLAEVVVRHQPLTATGIVQAAVARIAQNYPTEPFIMEGFYRDWTKSRMTEAYAQKFGMRQTATLLEAAVGVYDEGYAPKGNGRRGSHQVFVQEIRQSQQLPGDWYIRKGLSLGLEGDFVKNNRAKGCLDLVQGVLDFRNGLAYELLDTVVHNGESLYRIGAKAESEQNYRDRGMVGTHYQLYISQEDFTILQIDLKSATGPESGAATAGPATRRGGAKKDSSYWTCTLIDNTLRFRRYGGKAYPSYLRTHYATRRVNGPTGEAAAVGHEFFKELLVNDLHTEGVAERHRQLGQPVQQHQRVEAQLKPYNPAFWGHYNIIQDNPLDAELVEVLGQQKPLEKQFTESSPSAETPAKTKKKRQ